MNTALLSIMYPPTVGAETYANEISRALANRGHDVDAFLAQGDYDVYCRGAQEHSAARLETESTTTAEPALRKIERWFEALGYRGVTHTFTDPSTMSSCLPIPNATPKRRTK